MTVQTKWLYPPNFDGFYDNERVGNRRVVLQLSSVSDGTDETDVIKVVKGDLRRSDGQFAESLAVEKIEYDVRGFTSVILEWDHSPDEQIATLSGGNSGCINETFIDPGENGTGNIILTTAGADSGDSYNIILTVRLK